MMVSLDEILRTVRAMQAAGEMPGIARVGVFGSAARGEATADSDIDLFVEVMPDGAVGLFDLAMMQRRLEARLGCPIDITTRNGLHPAMRERILSEAVYA